MTRECIVAWYGPHQDESSGSLLRWLPAEQIDPFLQSLPRRIFLLESSPYPDHPLSCLVTEYGKRLPSSEDPRYGDIVAVGTSALFTPRELRTLAAGGRLPLVSDEEQLYYHPDWECRHCHSEKYPPRRHFLGGEFIDYDDGRYGVPMQLLCRVHGLAIHYQVYSGDEEEMLKKCARDCRSVGPFHCAGHCQAYWEQQQRSLLEGIYSLPDEEQKHDKEES